MFCLVILCFTWFLTFIQFYDNPCDLFYLNFLIVQSFLEKISAKLQNVKGKGTPTRGGRKMAWPCVGKIWPGRALESCIKVFLQFYNHFLFSCVHLFQFLTLVLGP